MKFVQLFTYYESPTRTNQIEINIAQSLFLSYYKSLHPVHKDRFYMITIMG